MNDSASFKLDFLLDSKAAVSEQDGDLFIEGYASDWGMDRDNESVEPGAFDRGLKRYLDTNPVLCFGHDYTKALGQVIAAKVDSVGLWIKARIDAPAVGSWAEDVFRKIQRGTIRAFSIGGKMSRKQTPAGRRIYDVELREISVVPLPANPRTLFAVATKAFDDVEDQADAELEAVEARIAALEAAAA